MINMKDHTDYGGKRIWNTRLILTINIYTLAVSVTLYALHTDH